MFLLHEIAKNPKVQDKLFAELCGALENGEDLDTNNIQKLSYAKNCMKETLRYIVFGAQYIHIEVYTPMTMGCTECRTCLVSTWFSAHPWIVSIPHSVPVHTSCT